MRKMGLGIGELDWIGLSFPLNQQTSFVVSQHFPNYVTTIGCLTQGIIAVIIRQICQNQQEYTNYKEKESYLSCSLLSSFSKLRRNSKNFQFSKTDINYFSHLLNALHEILLCNRGIYSIIYDYSTLNILSVFMRNISESQH